MNHRSLLVLACTAALAAVACKPPPPAPPAIEAAPVPAAAAIADPIAQAPSNSAAAAFDKKALAGTFRGTLPCADCDGTDTTLELMTDGAYVVNEVHQGKAGGGKMDGTWSVEASDQHLRLDPNSKAEDDRVFAITSIAQLAPLGADGEPAAGTSSRLVRVAPGSSP